MTQRPVRSVCTPLPGSVKPQRLRPVGFTWPWSTSGVEVLPERDDRVVGDADDAADLAVGAPGAEPDAAVVEDDDRRGAGQRREEHALVHHHPVVAVLGLERAVEGGGDALVDAGRAGCARCRGGR